ncbi:hypothetical protein Ocin01_13639 [Orchesella cincta]|uniref:Uncharacterized protein n=1 Tax=Orchesella cincta TaxID=48709 RepID=A0A1D2MJ83_ORCCI|nr:hypothetical protein Ocin01_13639 [Orchesella cincta]
MSIPTYGMRYFMPLTKGAPKDGPTTSVFSVPKVQYSPQTEAVVKNLMRESRLTFTQKHVFDTILRSGKSLPEHPEQMMASRWRQAYMQQRHKNKARRLGMELLNLEDSYRPPTLFHSYIRRGQSAPARRTLESIKASGDLERLPPPKTYIPLNKEAEKDRLAHKMAFGKDPPVEPVRTASKDVKQKPKKTMNDLKQERFEELIDEVQDRMQFLLSMDQLKKGKQYRACIISQINEKLQEMKQISPQKEKDVRDCLELELLDERLGSKFAEEHRTSKFFE